MSNLDKGEIGAPRLSRIERSEIYVSVYPDLPSCVAAWFNPNADYACGYCDFGCSTGG